MNEARGAVRAAALNHRIYAVGGRSETHAALSSVEVQKERREREERDR
jgi:hypothetical protein